MKYIMKEGYLFSKTGIKKCIENLTEALYQLKS